MNNHCTQCGTDFLVESRIDIRSRRLNQLTRIIIRFARRLDRYLQKKQRQKVDRDTYRQLQQLDDYSLRDIGLSRQDVVREHRIPLTQNVALELERISLGRHQY